MKTLVFNCTDIIENIIEFLEQNDRKNIREMNTICYYTVINMGKFARVCIFNGSPENVDFIIKGNVSIINVVGNSEKIELLEDTFTEKENDDNLEENDDNLIEMDTDEEIDVSIEPRDDIHIEKKYSLKRNVNGPSIILISDSVEFEYAFSLFSSTVKEIIIKNFFRDEVCECTHNRIGNTLYRCTSCRIIFKKCRLFVKVLFLYLEDCKSLERITILDSDITRSFLYHSLYGDVKISDFKLKSIHFAMNPKQLYYLEYRSFFMLAKEYISVRIPIEKQYYYTAFRKFYVSKSDNSATSTHICYMNIKKEIVDKATDYSNIGIELRIKDPDIIHKLNCYFLSGGIFNANLVSKYSI